MRHSLRLFCLPAACGILLFSLLIIAGCKRAPDENETASQPNSWGTPPASFQDLWFHASYDRVVQTLVQRYVIRGDAESLTELYFDGDFWGYPGTARLHFVGDRVPMLESVRVMVPAPLKQVVATVEPDFEACRPYARRRLKYGVAFFWSDSTRVIFTVTFMSKDFNNTEVAYIDSRPFIEPIDSTLSPTGNDFERSNLPR